MGYWDQIGEENRRHQEKRAAMPPLWRNLSDGLGTMFIIVASTALWVIMLSPLWLWLAG